MFDGAVCLPAVPMKHSVPTLSLEGVQVVSEGVRRLSLLQHAQVAEFLHLHFLRLLLPHRDHHLNAHGAKLLSEAATTQSLHTTPDICVQNKADLDFKGADGQFVQRDGEREDDLIRQDHRLI